MDPFSQKDRQDVYSTIYQHIKRAAVQSYVAFGTKPLRIAMMLTNCTRVCEGQEGMCSCEIKISSVDTLPWTDYAFSVPKWIQSEPHEQECSSYLKAKFPEISLAATGCVIFLAFMFIGPFWNVFAPTGFLYNRVVPGTCVAETKLISEHCFQGCTDLAKLVTSYSAVDPGVREILEELSQTHANLPDIFLLCSNDCKSHPVHYIGPF